MNLLEQGEMKFQTYIARLELLRSDLSVARNSKNFVFDESVLWMPEYLDILHDLVCREYASCKEDLKS